MHKIVRGYYKGERLIFVKDKKRVLNSKIPFIRFKILKNNKKWPCCDFHGECTSKAYAEVYPTLRKKGNGWSYLCREHYYKEQKRLGWKLPASLSVEW